MSMSSPRQKVTGDTLKIDVQALRDIRGGMPIHLFVAEIKQKTGHWIHPDTWRKFEKGERGLKLWKTLAALLLYSNTPLERLFPDAGWPKARSRRKPRRALDPTL